MTLPHPDADQITLPNVLAALGDDTRLAIVGYLARRWRGWPHLWPVLAMTSKTNLTYHLAKLREAGVVSVTPRAPTAASHCAATISTRFPGFLDTIIATAIHLPLDEDAIAE